MVFLRILSRELRIGTTNGRMRDGQCRMHPLSTFEAPARLDGACDSIATIGYILARCHEDLFEQFYAKVGQRGGGERAWRADTR
jgi:hypothetical protein